jgi:ABC-type spermidine/putrescine transport system permease subunit II
VGKTSKRLTGGLHRAIQPSLRRIVDRRIVFAAMGACAVAGLMPIVVGVVLSFCSVDMSGRFRLGSFEGYRAVFAAGRLHEFLRILSRAAVATAATMALSVPAAYCIARIARVSHKKIILGTLIAPWLVSDMLRAFGWQLLLSPAGPISGVWKAAVGAPLDGLRYNWIAVTVGLVSALLPAGILSVLAAIPEHGTAEWLAASEFGQPRHVFVLMGIRRARYGILFGSFAVFILGCFASAEARFLDGPTQSSIQTVTSSLVNDGVPALLAFGSLLVVFVVVVCIVAAEVRREVDRLLKRRRQAEVGEDSPDRAPLYSRPTRARWLGSLLDGVVRIATPFAMVVAVVLCIAPVAAVAAEAFREPTSTGMSWTIANFSRMLASSALVDAVINSCGIAFAVAVVAASVGFALSISTWDRRVRGWVLILLPTLVLLPGDAYAVNLFQIARLFGRLEGSALLVVVAHALWAIPFATGTLLLANAAMSTDILEAALEFGRGPIDVIVRIIGRINLGRIAAVAMLAGTLSLNEYARASYLSGGLLTIGSEVLGRLNAGLLPENRGVFAAALLMFLLSLATTILTLRLVRVGRSWSLNSDT